MKKKTDPDISSLLNASEEKYRTFFENSMDAILITSQDGKIYSANKAACNMLDWSESDIISLGRNGIVVQSTQLDDALTERKKTGKFFGEIWFIKRDGTRFPVEITSSVFTSDGKELTAIIARDITERKNTEKALKQSEERLRLAGKATGFGTYSYDFHSGSVYYSDEFGDLYGLSPGVISSLDQDLLYKATLPVDIPHVIKAMRSANDPTGSGILDVEFRIFLPDKSIRWLRARGLTSFTGSAKEDKPLFSNGIVQDITYSKKTEAELIKSKKLLEKLNQHLIEVRENERSEIALNIHDDLGQKLTAIDLDVAWLKGRVGVQTPAVVSKFNDINKMINETIDGIKEISSFLRPSILYDLGIVTAFEWQLRKTEKISKIKCNFNYSLGEKKIDDRISLILYRVLQESLTNVVRHSGASKVSVELMVIKKVVNLTIEDNGIGVMYKKRSSFSSLGITGIKERVAGVKGKVVINGKKNHGTIISVEVPLLFKPNL
jgi:PAS domain S-box-containing protein